MIASFVLYAFAVWVFVPLIERHLVQSVPCTVFCMSRTSKLSQLQDLYGLMYGAHYPHKTRHKMVSIMDLGHAICSVNTVPT